MSETPRPDNMTPEQTKTWEVIAHSEKQIAEAQAKLDALRVRLGPRPAQVNPWRSLRELLADPQASAPPVAVVPHLAWKGRVTLLAAREKGGKSTLAAAGVAALTAGRPFLGEVTTAGRVLWVAAEEHPP